MVGSLTCGARMSESMWRVCPEPRAGPEIWGGQGVHDRFSSHLDQWGKTGGGRFCVWIPVGQMRRPTRGAVKLL